MNIIKRDATFSVLNNKVGIGGTNTNQPGDLLADILLLIPKRTKAGFVSWSVYQQALSVYEQSDLMCMDEVTIGGHSLGGAAAILLALIMLENGYTGKININALGSPKVVSSKVASWLQPRLNSISWRVRHRDIVCFLGWWKEPKHDTIREGNKRKHIFDWDFKEHLMY